MAAVEVPICRDGLRSWTISGNAIFYVLNSFLQRSNFGCCKRCTRQRRCCRNPHSHAGKHCMLVLCFYFLFLLSWINFTEAASHRGQPALVLVSRGGELHFFFFWPFASCVRPSRSTRGFGRTSFTMTSRTLILVSEGRNCIGKRENANCRFRGGDIITVYTKK